MAVTLREVGLRAGVSAMTVSRVINGRPGVDADTQRRVEEAIAALDYVPNRIARGLISQKTETLGLIVPDVANSTVATKLSSKLVAVPTVATVGATTRLFAAGVGAPML